MSKNRHENDKNKNQNREYIEQFHSGRSVGNFIGLKFFKNPVVLKMKNN